MNRYITPQKIFKDKNLPIVCDIAIICFCPMPNNFKQYQITETSERLFLMLHPNHVMFCQYNNINFVVLAEVYGGPVGVSIVEELHYYGVSCILSLGYVGSFTNGLDIGMNIKCDKTLSETGTTPYYSSLNIIETDDYIDKIFDMNKSMIWTTNAIYREYKKELDDVKNHGCQCVNMDTSHLFASCKLLNIMHAYFATVTDVLSESDNWDENLIESVNNNHMNKVLIGQNKIVDNIIDKLDTINQLIINKYETYNNQLINKVSKLFNDKNICKSHDINHILRVVEHVNNSIKYMSLSIKLKYLISYAAILHDVDDTKFFETNNYINARQMLLSLNLSDDDIELVIKMISYVSTTANGNTVPNDAKQCEYLLYPRYADRLDALGINGVIRCYQYAKTKKMPLYTENTFKPTSLNDVWSIATMDRYKNYKGNSESMIDHYYDKLLQLGNFETNNEYFNKTKETLKQPLFDILDKFIKNELTDEYMKSLII